MRGRLELPPERCVGVLRGARLVAVRIDVGPPRTGKRSRSDRLPGGIERCGILTGLRRKEHEPSAECETTKRLYGRSLDATHARDDCRVGSLQDRGPELLGDLAFDDHLDSVAPFGLTVRTGLRRTGPLRTVRQREVDPTPRIVEAAAGVEILHEDHPHASRRGEDPRLRVVGGEVVGA